VGDFADYSERGLFLKSRRVSAGVSGSYNHPAGVAKAIKEEVKKKISPHAGIILASQPT
jgi:hypothetical protein